MAAVVVAPDQVEPKKGAPTEAPQGPDPSRSLALEPGPAPPVHPRVQLGHAPLSSTPGGGRGGAGVPHLPSGHQGRPGAGALPSYRPWRWHQGRPGADLSPNPRLVQAGIATRAVRKEEVDALAAKHQVSFSSRRSNE